MNVKEYLAHKNLTLAHMAEELGIHRNHLSAIANKRYLPGRMLAKEIVRYTNGEIALEDLLPDEEKKFCSGCGRKLPKSLQANQVDCREKG